MNIYDAIRILIKKLKYIIILPIVAGVLMYFATRNIEKKFSVNTTLYTGITSGTYVENVGSTRVDFFATQNAYNNIIELLRSEALLKEVSLRLLAHHLMLTEPDKFWISPTSHEALQIIVPKEVKALAEKSNFSKTYENINRYMVQDKDNFVYGLLHYNHPHYSLQALSQIKVYRLASSDIIQISYENNDPAVTYATLKILIEVFIDKYNEFQSNQTDAVVAYFEKKLQEAHLKLKDSEDRLLAFNTSNEIINYYEQTKHVSSQQEKIEVKLQDIQLEYDAAKAVLAKLETETQTRFDINLRNKDILEIRRDLIEVNNKMARKNIDSDVIDEEYQELAKQQKALQEQLQSKIDVLQIYERNSQGIEIKKLLEDWLSTLIEYESARARLQAMEAKKVDFMLQYQKYAPLGAQLMRIEREIDVNEREYLEILHHLGLARLKQQNAAMMANMKVVDEPNLPITSSPDKSKLFVIVIALFTAIFYILILFVSELLDRRIKNSTRLQKFSGLNVLTAFLKQSNVTNYFYDNLTKRATFDVLENLRLENPKSTEPIVVQLVSVWSGEGKSHVTHELKNHLNQSGFPTLVVSAMPNANADLEILPEQLIKWPNYDEVLKKLSRPAQYEFILVELPPLSDGIANPELMQSAHKTLLVVDANRTWTTADGFYMAKLDKLKLKSFHAIINQSLPDQIEDIMGEVPKKRSAIRKFIKNRVLKRYV